VKPLARMTRRELEEHATRILAAHRLPTQRDDDDGTPCEWTLSPVAAEVEHDDEDAAWIAATFADLSGARLCAAWVARCAARADERDAEKRSYMREVRRPGATLTPADATRLAVLRRREVRAAGDLFGTPAAPRKPATRAQEWRDAEAARKRDKRRQVAAAGRRRAQVVPPGQAALRLGGE
jgi:hypothetical protein